MKLSSFLSASLLAIASYVTAAAISTESTPAASTTPVCVWHFLGHAAQTQVAGSAQIVVDDISLDCILDFEHTLKDATKSDVVVLVSDWLEFYWHSRLRSRLQYVYCQNLMLRGTSSPTLVLLGSMASHRARWAVMSGGNKSEHWA